MDTKTAICVLAEAREWLGTPYHHRGMAKGAGCDCGSFLHMVYTKFGLQMDPFPDDYPADWAIHRHDERYLDFVTRYCRETDRPTPGDIVVFQYGAAYSHGGIVTDTRTVIHAYGRNEVGAVMDSDWSFFNYPGGKMRKRKYYEVPL